MELGLCHGHIVLDRDPASPKRGTAPPIIGPCLLWPNGWMDQDPLGRELSLGPGDIVLDGDPAPTKKGEARQLPHFRPVSIVAKRSPISATAELSLCLIHITDVPSFVASAMHVK